jgi:hypothetical protein
MVRGGTMWLSMGQIVEAQTVADREGPNRKRGLRGQQ